MRVKSISMNEWTCGAIRLAQHHVLRGEPADRDPSARPVALADRELRVLDLAVEQVPELVRTA